ncbi:o-succinylbenzoate--CoA ligase [Biostraticola tofi]|uniref:O-succinylbenzoic acid--CoA ligase n=1 Tax=Biostraticola tofi TaxID=466109 RepID=A0A4R3Z5G1_9GAMM|nr:o-succinylbenzoate--CoA ligase [Biostraticola tofi]TCW00299.1 O-succinylbenzoic acid--CoA ligase [Biostraticola tofi]
MTAFDSWPWQCWAGRTADTVALCLDQQPVSWRQLAIAIDRQAEALRQAGLAEGCGLALRGHNGPQLLIGYLAGLQCGARVIPLNPRLPSSLLSRLLPLLGCDFGWSEPADAWPAAITPVDLLPTEALFMSAGLAPSSAGSTAPASPPALLPVPINPAGLHRASLPNTTAPAGLRRASLLNTTAPAGLHRASLPNATAPAEAASPAVWNPARIASLTLTSGSSGLPKAAAHTPAAHLANAVGINKLLDFTDQHRWLLSLPLYHVSGQGIVWRWLAAGACLRISARPLSAALSGCTHASLVPTQLWRLLNENADSLKALQDVLLGGATIPPALTADAQGRGIRCWCGYGLTEFASTVCAQLANDQGGVGLPLPGRYLKLVAGEIWLRGAGMAAGYWQPDGVSPLTGDDGWFHTRDRGRLENGQLRIIGRLDNLFFCGSEAVQPEDIERLLAAHPAVRQCVIVPVDDDEFGQRPVAVVDSDAPVEHLAAWLTPQLAAWQRPVNWLPMPAGLGNGGIKIARGQVRDWVRQTLRLR